MILHTYTSNQCPYQVATSYTLRFLTYSLDKILKVTAITRSKVKSSNTMMLHTYNPQSISLPSINILHLVPEIQPGQDFMVKATTVTVRSKVRSTSLCDIADQHP